MCINSKSFQKLSQLLFCYSSKSNTMMKLVVFTVLVGVAFGAFRGDPKLAQIIRSDSNIDPDGTYQYSYETENGISVNENGTPKGVGGTDPPPIVAEGGYKYESPEGEVIDIQYVADENGYQPYGNAIPTPPPIPPAIARSLEYIAANPEFQSNNNKQYFQNNNNKQYFQNNKR